ncbi:MAG: PEP-CTERM sorting domain-containing protein [Bryobacterales bacterium]|nr:PEP-CTERM sorting domain-containing protein [Bryobacterales bacterium]
MKLNALFATLLLATTTCASATVLTFDSVAVSGCSDGAAYMAGFGITVTGAASARICNSAPVGGAQAYSGSNLLLLDNPPPSNSTYTYFFTFTSPVANVSFVRTQINPDSTGPAWTATALSASSSVLTSTGEGTTFAPSAQVFSLNANGIASIRFDTDNTSARTYNTPPIDDLSFSSVPEPGTLPLTVMAILGTVLWRRKTQSARDPR